ncbi:hypothetical protein OQA88_7795 [Cercophora sp. LCS_1]
MTDDAREIPDPVAPAKEDAETTAARRELKQTSISEKLNAGQQQQNDGDPQQQSGSEDDDKDQERVATPDTDPGHVPDLSPKEEERLKEYVSSPKKKRAHDELVADGTVSATSGEGHRKPADYDAADAQSRTEESEPEKKRPRDRETETTRRRSQDGVESASSRSSLDKTAEVSKESSKNGTSGEGKQPQTSASAFAASGFAKLAASTTSPFGSLSGAGKPSLFGSSLGSFSVLGGSKPAASGAALPLSAAPKLSFASGALSSPSPFAVNGGKPTGSVFGGSPFTSSFGGSALSGAKLSTFGKPGESLKSDKPAKPFGAPESDGEDESDKEGDGEESGSEKEEGKDAEKEKEKEAEKASTEEKKKLRLQKIVVDDGEGDEVTLLAVRTKMFMMEKGVGWKERGGGMLKVNVPKSTIELDDFGNVDPHSFDASVLEDEVDENGHRKCVRLIMRQDHTLRVILNTVVVPAMTFRLDQKLKAAFVLFTAFDEGEAKQMSDSNATLFTQLMEMIQKQLSDI